MAAQVLLNLWEVDPEVTIVQDVGPSIYVRLSETDMRLARAECKERIRVAKESNTYRRPFMGSDVAEFIGVQGELAVSRAKGLPVTSFGWSTEDWICRNTSRNTQQDLPGIEVRTTIYRTGRLKIQFNEDPALKYVLGIYLARGLIKIAGWIPGAAGMKKKFIDNPGQFRPAYFVKQYALLGMNTISAPLDEIPNWWLEI